MAGTKSATGEGTRTWYAATGTPGSTLVRRRTGSDEQGVGEDQVVLRVGTGLPRLPRPTPLTRLRPAPGEPQLDQLFGQTAELCM